MTFRYHSMVKEVERSKRLMGIGGGRLCLEKQMDVKWCF